MRNNKTTKGNKRPIKKLIALWVVFAMLVVPFASHVGKKEGAKAAPSDIVYCSSVGTVTYNPSVSITKSSAEADADIDNHNTEYDVYLVKNAQKLSLAVSQGSNYAPANTYSYVYVEYSPEDIVKNTLDGTETTTALNVAPGDSVDVTEVENDKKYGIYAKWTSAGTQKAFQLQCVVNVHRVTFSSADGIYDSTETIELSDSQIVSSAKLKAAVENVDKVSNATVNYYVSKDDLTADKKTVASSYNRTLNTIDCTDANICNRTVYAYAAIIDNRGTETDTDDVVLAYEKLGSVFITNDTTPPDILNPVIEKSNDSSTWTSDENSFTDTDGVYYGNSAHYRYVVTCTDPHIDGQTEVGLADTNPVMIQFGSDSPVAMTYDSTEGKYVYKLDSTSPYLDGTTSVKVTACDKANNSATPVDLKKIKHVQSGTKVTGQKFEDNTWDGTSSLVYYNTSKTLVVTLETTLDNIGSVKIENGSEVYAIAPNAEGTNRIVVGDPTEKRVRLITAEFVVPKSADTNEILDGYSIVAYTNDATPSAVTTDDNSLKKLHYDKTKPYISIDDSYIAILNDSSVWENVAGAKYTEGVAAYVSELNKQYRYYVKVTDAETYASGMDGVYCENNTPFTKDTTNEGWWYYDIPLSGLDGGATYSLSFYGKDSAGNVTDVTRLRDVRKIRDDLIVNHPVITDNNNTDVTLDVASGKYTNGKLKMSVNVTSAYTINSVELKGDGYTKEATIPSTQNKNSDNRYDITVTFDLPEDNLNAFFDSLCIEAKDDRTPETIVRYPDSPNNIGSILYDCTRPGLNPISALDTNKWYHEYDFVCEISSGSQTVESDIDTASYMLGACDGEVGQNVALSPSGRSFQSTISIPQSTSVEGTLIEFAARDKCGNVFETTPSYRIKVDGEEPKITLFDVNKKTILSNALEGDVTIRANVSDNLTIASATIRVVGPDGIDVTKSLCDAGERVGIGKDNSFTLDALLGKKAPDGNYTVTVKVSDKAGNAASDRTISFTVDNTIPVVTAKIAGGTTAGKQPGTNFDGTVCDYFYRSNVPVVLTYEDDNLAASGVTVTDNGNKLKLNWERLGGSNKYQATYTATQEGAHTVKITAKDDAGNDAVAKQVVFIKDITAPTITAVLNGGIVYSEGMGEVDLTSAASLNLSVNDKNEDAQDFHYQLVKTAPDTLPVTADYISTNNRTFAFADEADYLVNAYAIDKAGNKGLIKSVLFRVDTTAPEIKISGAASGSSLNAGTTLTFTMTEAFWKDASGTVTITRKAGDGASESTYKTIDYKPTARTTNISESLTETGEYKVTFTAKDRAGHTSEAATYTVKIDKDKPVITLNGVANNDKTTGEVEFLAQIEDDFYLTKAISIKATRTYLDETTYQEKTEDIKFTGYNAAASDTIIRDTFKEDGFYKIQITCKDAAGNEDTQEVSFTIDKSKPFIDSKVLGAYEGTLTAFAWDYDISDLVYDLTVCDVHMYLNGSEYDGTSEIEDGAYEMKITAEDELGNYVEQIVNFTLDTKAPTFIVTGVEDGEVKNEQYTIEVSLQLDEDVLDSVSLNGSAVEVKDNKASLTVSDKGDYELTMKAHDAAGNEAEKTIRFTYGEKSTWWLYLIIGVAAVLAIGGVIFVVVRKKNN